MPTVEIYYNEGDSRGVASSLPFKIKLHGTEERFGIHRKGITTPTTLPMLEVSKCSTDNSLFPHHQHITSRPQTNNLLWVKY